MEKKSIGKKWIIGGVAYAVLFLAVIIISNWAVLTSLSEYILRILRPVVIGLTLAYILNPVFVFFERKLFCRLNPPSVRRFISLLLSYIVMFLLVICLLLMILPQLFDSLVSLLKNYQEFITSSVDYINGNLESINESLAKITQKQITFEYINDEKLLTSVTDFLSSVSVGESGNLLDYINSSEVLYDAADILSGTVSVIADLVLGIFISLYFLVSKEKRAAQIMRMRQAIFNDTANGRISRIISTLDKSFGSFIKGKALDSLIIGVLLYIPLSIFKIPFALLISAFIAILNIIPFFGYLVAMIPTALIVFLTEPEKLFLFLFISILVQQIDVNIICPKILGNNTGVSSLCIVVAISTMGALWGLTGILIGVPLFATILALSDYYLEKNLQKKGLPSEIESYYPNDAIVDPVKDSHLYSDKFLRRLEKNILRIYRNRQTAEPEKLTKLESLRLKIYRFARKYNIISEFTDETVVQFCADQEHQAFYRAAKNAYMESTSSVPVDTNEQEQEK